MVSGTRCPYVSVCEGVVVRGAAAPKGPMTYAVFIWASRLELGPGGWDLSLCRTKKDQRDFVSSTFFQIIWYTTCLYPLLPFHPFVYLISFSLHHFYPSLFWNVPSHLLIHACLISSFIKELPFPVISSTVHWQSDMSLGNTFKINKICMILNAAL